MDQGALVRELGRFRTFPDHPPRVDLVQTHLSYIFLTPTRAYKIKKAVDLGFADFSTLARRRRFCRIEVVINRRLARRVYLGVAPITCLRGRPVVGGRGVPIEYAVVMKRLSDARLLARRLRKGPGDYLFIDRVARRLAHFYREEALEPGAPNTGARAMARIVRANFKILERFTGTLFNKEAIEELERWSKRGLAALGPRIERRAREGRAVEGHGDLHLEHIYVNGAVEILDGTEFARRYRVGDVAQDVAFLAMDLDARGRHDLARHLVRALARRLRDPDLPGLLPLFKAYRALVRAKVNALLSEEAEVPKASRVAARRRALRYARLAKQIAAWRGGPALIVVGGLTGTGKTRIALDLARRYGMEWVATDVIRKLIAGLDPFTPARHPPGSGLYTPSHGRRTMRALLREAGSLLRAGRPVVLDGTFRRRAERAAVRRLARRPGRPRLS
jgi:aminoglycoside phosphotransferase family enzyme